MKIIIHPAVDPDRLAAFRASAPEASWVNATTASEAESAIVDADAFLGKITAPMLAVANRLRWVQSFTASLEHYMFPELIAHPCILTNTRGLFGDVIADQVMGYVLCFARNLHTYVRRQLEHRYEPVGSESARVDFAAGPGTVNAIDRATIDLREATLGIVGFGQIGGEIARRASAFGMHVRAVDRFPDRREVPAGIDAVWDVERLPQLLAWSEFVVIAAPHTPETARLFDRRMFLHMRPNGYLINIGRGAIVVLDDLVTALRDGLIAGAALDVFEQEPLPADHPLWDFPNVILTPHTAGYSPVIARRHTQLLIENLKRFASGQPLANVVDKALWF